MQPYPTDQNNQIPPAHAPEHYPNHRFIPSGAPVQGFPTYSPQQYTFVPGIGFVRRSPQDDERAQLRTAGTRLAAAMLFCLALMYLVYPVASLLSSRIVMLFHGSVSTAAAGLLSTTITYLAAVLIPFGVYQARVGIPMRAAFALRRPRAWLVVCGTLMFLAVTVVASFSSEVLDTVLGSVGLYARQNSAAMPADPFGIVLYVLLYVALSSVVEEFIFRGLVLQSLRRFGDGLALVCSSLLFALIHTDLLILPYAFLSGLVLGYFVLRSGSLVTGIVIHSVNNLFWVVYDVAAKGIAPAWSGIVQEGISIVFILCGLVGLIVAARRDKNLFTLAPANAVLPFKARLQTLMGSGAMILLYIAASVIMATSISTTYIPW